MTATVKGANELTLNEVDALLFALDDEDFLGDQTIERSRLLRGLWRRLHMWRLAKRGDTDAAAILQREFPYQSAVAR